MSETLRGLVMADIYASPDVGLIDERVWFAVALVARHDPNDESEWPDLSERPVGDREIEDPEQMGEVEQEPFLPHPYPKSGLPPWQEEW
jgi:hypothetical protein